MSDAAMPTNPMGPEEEFMRLLNSGSSGANPLGSLVTAQLWKRSFQMEQEKALGRRNG
jgi:hypothetical protein